MNTYTTSKNRASNIAELKKRISKAIEVEFDQQIYNFEYFSIQELRDCIGNKKSTTKADIITDKDAQIIKQAFIDRKISSHTKINTTICPYTQKKGIKHHQITSKGAEAIAQGMSNKNLKDYVFDIDLSSHQIKDEGANAIGQALTDTKLSKLTIRLRRNKIGNEGVRAIAKGITFTKLSWLEISLDDNEITDEGIKIIARSIANTDLVGLDISLDNMQITEDGIKALIEAINSTKLVSLKVRMYNVENKMSKEIQDKLFHAVRKRNLLRELTLKFAREKELKDDLTATDQKPREELYTKDLYDDLIERARKTKEALYAYFGKTYLQKLLQTSQSEIENKILHDNNYKIATYKINPYTVKKVCFSLGTLHPAISMVSHELSEIYDEYWFSDARWAYL